MSMHYSLGGYPDDDPYYISPEEEEAMYVNEWADYFAAQDQACDDEYRYELCNV